MIDTPLDVAEAGRTDELSPVVRRILAPNPSVMTGQGTNTYLVGRAGDDIAVIDPGPDEPAHLDAIVTAALELGSRISWIIVTHTHPDHWPGAAGLAERTGAPVLAYDARNGLQIDERLTDGNVVPIPGAELGVLHTPGHASDHLCLLLEDDGTGRRVLFTGDHVMHGSTVVIFPPDGDMRLYLQQLERAIQLEPAQLAPGHGQLFDDPAAAIQQIIDHRMAREAKVLDVLDQLPNAITITVMVGLVYDDIDPVRIPIAKGSLWAHLRKLYDDGRAATNAYDDFEHGKWSKRWTARGR